MTLADMLCAPDGDDTAWRRTHDIAERMIASRFKREIAADQRPGVTVTWSLWYVADAYPAEAEKIASRAAAAVVAR